MNKSTVIANGTGFAHFPVQDDKRILQTVLIDSIIETGTIGKRKANQLVGLHATASCEAGDEKKYLVEEGESTRWELTTFKRDDGTLVINANRPFQQDTVEFEIS